MSAFQLLVRRVLSHSLIWSDVRDMVGLEAPQLLSSFQERSEWVAAAASSGWQLAGKKGRARSEVPADLLQQWLESDPETDWQLKEAHAMAAQQLEAQRLAAEEAQQWQQEQQPDEWQGGAGPGNRAVLAFVVFVCMEVKYSS